MRPTRQLWGVGILAASFAALAAVFNRPLLFAVTALLGAWIVARQYLFLATLREMRAALTVSQIPETGAIRTGESTTVTLEATFDRPRTLSLTVDAGLPSAAAADEPLTLSMTPAETTTSRTVTVEWPVTGRYRFEKATLTATDGLFETTLPVGSTPTVTVEPRGPRSIHVGKGGNRTAISQGEHVADRSGSGVDPAEIREYLPGDAADRIDWKATARLASVHIREFEVDTDRPTTLFVDHRESLAQGTEAETKFAYLREVAIATVASARRLGDPIGLVTIGDAGITSRFDPSTGPRHHTSIRQRLLDLEPTAATDRAEATDDAGPPSVEEAITDPLAVASRQGDHQLVATETLVDSHAEPTAQAEPFVRTLKPFYADQQYRTRFDGNPLLGAVKSAVGRQYDRSRTIICTDDTEPEALYEAVRYARTKNTDVMVLLTPSVLFRVGGLADLDRAYDQYQSFERFRRKLDQLEGVSAYEVAPDDRLSALLDFGRDRPRPRGVVQ
jgi:uncharacterized protein (DUF58 family)